MSIDRIGKGSVPPGAPGASEVGSAGTSARPEEASRPFEVRTDKAVATDKSASPAQVDAALATTPLDRLRAGQIDVPAYLDLKVRDATAHLHGVRPSELDAIRKMLRDQLATDPALADLVKQATGRVPPPFDDE